MNRLNTYLDILPEVAAAMAAGRGVVALESTIIAHGMPYPENLQCALDVAQEIMAQGAVPAAIAVINGRLKVGLTKEELEHLAQSKDVAKLSRRDVAWSVVQKTTGATTVAATMMIAAMAGIRVFATGGIGGVHRKVEETMDISADLEELALTPVAVVCAGAKSILDLAKTLEYLETKGVPVIGFQSNQLAAFYSRESGLNLEHRMDREADIAAYLRVKWELDPRGGAVISVPVPEAYALAAKDMEEIITQSLRVAEAREVYGKAVTPFLLARVKEQTHGESLKTNIALVRNNARVAAGIAKAMTPPG